MLLLLWCSFLFVAAYADPVRICVPESLEAACSQMSTELPESYTCVVEPDRLSCLQKVSKGEADVTNADPRAIYLGGKNFNLVPVATELVNGEPYRYHGIALVRKDSNAMNISDLRGMSSCHTGVGRTVGWNIPIGKLMAAHVMDPKCPDGELAAAENFFGGSCAPGKWSSDPTVDQNLKSKYQGLCSKCKNPSSCSSDDEYAGYEGVLKCLESGSGEVAFTKTSVLKKYLETNPTFAETTDLLCFEGGRRDPLDPNPCIWGSRPTNAFVTNSGKSEAEKRELGSVLMSTQARYDQSELPEWYYKSFLSGEKVNGLRITEPERSTYLTYLGDFINAIRKPHPGCDNEQAPMCVTSDEELLRCREYSMAAEARGIWPTIGCIQAETKEACMQHVKDRHAQLLVLDGGDVYKAGRYYELQPLAGELYGESDANYYAVAVLRSVSNVTRLADLKGLQSCHTGMGRTAGWVMPVGALLSAGLLDNSSDCNRAEVVADFFTGGSCVPGANDTKSNPGKIRSEDLCKQCIGDEQGLHKCSRDNRERYNGYAGSLRCLAEGQGDVAFVKHSTVPDYTDGRSTAPWAKELLSSDFRLLCAKKEGTYLVTEYHDCNLGRVPSHYVMTNDAASRLQLAKLLADSSQYFADDSDLFRLFHTYRGLYQDLLFKDSATGLRVAPLDASYKQVLGEEFLTASKASDPKNGCAI